MARAVRTIVFAPIPSVGPPPPGIPPSAFHADATGTSLTLTLPVVFTSDEELTRGLSDNAVITISIDDAVSPGLFKQAVWDALQTLAAQLGITIQRQQVLLLVIPSVGV